VIIPRLLVNVNVINIKSKAQQRMKGYFEIDVQPSDTALSLVGFQSLRVKVTNDWIKTKLQNFLTEKAIALEEVVFALLI
jgi:hypothetical protein